jgi:TRAP-type C4-dicarboxylate transport system permease small subunit
VQTKINLGSTAPASGLSMGWIYGVGVAFSVPVGLILAHDLYRILTGRIAQDELVMVVESEEHAELEALRQKTGSNTR